MPLNGNRRSFLAQLTGLVSVGGVAIANRPAGAGARGIQAAVSTRQIWDTTWLDSLAGKHKQVYDLMWHTLRTNTLNPPMNYFDAHKEMSGLEFPDVNVVIGINSTPFPINASDALWAKFKLGERYNIKDPGTGQPATRNVYLGTTGGTGSTVRALQARGAVFLMCNNSLQALAADWSREMGKTASELHAELVAGLNPGVWLVPALTWAVVTLQERGFTYERL
jgi:intracellular sulfur oxidation DsrE/DsrF family protein